MPVTIFQLKELPYYQGDLIFDIFDALLKVVYQQYVTYYGSYLHVEEVYHLSM